MKNKNLWQSVRCAARGISSAFRTEKNLKTYVIIAAVFLVLNIISGSGKYDYIILAVCSCGVFSAEFINTAVERACDSRSREFSEDAAFIKDVSAGAVLAWGIVFFVAEAVVLVSNFASVF